MAETKPTKVGRWATDANRTLEPAIGEKDVGWEVAKKPPARFMNWLHNVAYQWFNWCNERMFDGGSAKDFEIRGVDIATGTDVDGGDLELGGGSSTGDGGSKVTFKVAKANQGAGAAVRTPAQVGEFDDDGVLKTEGIEATAAITNGDGVKGTGDTSGSGVEGTGGTGGAGVKGIGKGGTTATASVVGVGDGYGGYFEGAPGYYGCIGQGGGNAAGVRGTGGATNDNGVEGLSDYGHGVVAQGDTTSPAKSALAIVPQDAAPTGPNAIGDIYVTAAGIPYICTVAGTPGTWTKISAT